MRRLAAIGAGSHQLPSHGPDLMGAGRLTFIAPCSHGLLHLLKQLANHQSKRPVHAVFRPFSQGRGEGRLSPVVTRCQQWSLSKNSRPEPGSGPPLHSKPYIQFIPYAGLHPVPMRCYSSFLAAMFGTRGI